jgi:hypothetical protein
MNSLFRSKKFVLAVILIAAASLGGVLWLRKQTTTVEDELPAGPVSAQQAFEETYLNAALGKEFPTARKCTACHDGPYDLDQQTWKFLKERSALSKDSWASAIPLNTKCGLCHVIPPPSSLPKKSWIESIERMQRIIEVKNSPKMTEQEGLDVLHYYFTFSREHFPSLPEDPNPDESPLKFESHPLGNPAGTNELPVIGHVQIVDLDGDGRQDVLACDTDASQLTWVHWKHNNWQEETLAKIPCPAHTAIITNALSERLDIVVACQRVMAPTDDPVGSVVLLINEGQNQFKPLTLVENISRVADVEPGDFDGDGDIDFVVAAYGYIKTGEIGWLENKGESKFIYHTILKRAGAIHVPVIDLNGDGHLDFVALFAQEHEQISAFLNDGKGGFAERVLFKAATPSFGSSGIQLVDLDQDGDMDILYTNGDNMDLRTMIPRPYHGVQWLENKGNLNFEWHDICRFYGAYCAVAGDLNRDGKLDIAVTSMFNDWNDPQRDSLIWLENDGTQHFIPHGIAHEPIYLISAALGDLSNNGSLQIVTAGMHAFPPFTRDKMSRLTLWTGTPE